MQILKGQYNTSQYNVLVVIAKHPKKKAMTTHSISANVLKEIDITIILIDKVSDITERSSSLKIIKHGACDPNHAYINKKKVTLTRSLARRTNFNAMGKSIK